MAIIVWPYYRYLLYMPRSYSLLSYYRYYRILFSMLKLSFSNISPFTPITIDLTIGIFFDCLYKAFFIKLLLLNTFFDCSLLLNQSITTLQQSIAVLSVKTRLHEAPVNSLLSHMILPKIQHIIYPSTPARTSSNFVIFYSYTQQLLSLLSCIVIIAYVAYR